MPTLKNFTACERKFSLIGFGIFPAGYNLDWIETVSDAPPEVYTHPTTITGTMNGTNPTFVLSGVTLTPGRIILALNGLVMVATTAYTISGGTLTMQSGFIPESGDTLVAYVWE